MKRPLTPKLGSVGIPTLLSLIVGNLFATPALSLAAEPPSKKPIPPKEVAQNELSANNFDLNFLKGLNPNAEVDLQYLFSGDGTTPGSYDVTVYINDRRIGRTSISFVENPAISFVEACLPLDTLDALGINLKKLDKQALADVKKLNQDCYFIKQVIPESEVRYDPQSFRLDLVVPQMYSKVSEDGYVDPSLWEDGVTAAYSNYSLSGRREMSGQNSGKSNYSGSFSNGINLYGWRFKNTASMNAGTGIPTRFSSNSNYAQHDVSMINGVFTIGQFSTSGRLFSGVSIKGAKVETDEAMYPDALRNYAPAVRGIAESNATVEVRQNDFLIFTSNVPPGPFEFTEFNGNPRNGDIEVTVIEASGRRLVTTQAYGRLPKLINQGRFDYHVSAGTIDNTRYSITPKLVNAEFTYGLTDLTTVEGGTQVSDKYYALATSINTVTRFGAVAVDASASHSRAKERTKQGYSIRVNYAQSLSNVGTSFIMTTQRYSTDSFRTFQDHVDDLNNEVNKRRSKIRNEIKFSQNLGQNSRYGNLSLSFLSEQFWQQDNTKSYSIGYGNRFKNVSVGINYTQTRNLVDSSGAINNDKRLTISLSMPLGKEIHSPMVSANYNRDGNGNYSASTFLSGGLRNYEQIRYNLSATKGSNSTNAAAGVFAATSYADLNISYSASKDNGVLNFGARGSAIAHRGGLNFGRPINGTMILVHAPKAPGLGVSSGSTGKTGYNGYALISNANPYRVNTVRFSTNDLSPDIEIDSSDILVIPRRDAVVLASVAVTSGRRVRFKLVQANDEPIPFGALVFDQEGNNLGMADPGSQAMVLLNEDKGRLQIRWSTFSCDATYDLPPRQKGINYDRAILKCIPGNDPS